MKVSILIPCHDEEASIAACLDACLDQTRVPDEIVVVDDGSRDRSAEILAGYGDRIRVVTLPAASGTKSRAQEQGLGHVTGDVFVATDGDSMLDRHCVERMLPHFADPEVVAVCGYVRSLRHNWLTACRELEYLFDQDVLKRIQAGVNAIAIIPGCAGAFRTEFFRRHVGFDHDTLTEDRDFTMKIHRSGMRIAYARDAVVYTQDPTTLGAFIGQTRRWYGGAWQNLRKHHGRPGHDAPMGRFLLLPLLALVLGPALWTVPLWGGWPGAVACVLSVAAICALAGWWRERVDLVLCFPLMIATSLLRMVLFLEQFLQQIALGRRDAVWYQPPRQALRYRRGSVESAEPCAELRQSLDPGGIDARGRAPLLPLLLGGDDAAEWTEPASGELLGEPRR